MKYGNLLRSLKITEPPELIYYPDGHILRRELYRFVMSLKHNRGMKWDVISILYEVFILYIRFRKNPLPKNKMKKLYLRGLKGWKKDKLSTRSILVISLVWAVYSLQENKTNPIKEFLLMLKNRFGESDYFKMVENDFYKPMMNRYGGFRIDFCTNPMENIVPFISQYFDIPLITNNFDIKSIVSIINRFRTIKNQNETLNLICWSYFELDFEEELQNKKCSKPQLYQNRLKVEVINKIRELINRGVLLPKYDFDDDSTSLPNLFWGRHTTQPSPINSQVNMNLKPLKEMLIQYIDFLLMTIQLISTLEARDIPYDAAMGNLLKDMQHSLDGSIPYQIVSTSRASKLEDKPCAIPKNTQQPTTSKSQYNTRLKPTRATFIINGNDNEGSTNRRLKLLHNGLTSKILRNKSLIDQKTQLKSLVALFSGNPNQDVPTIKWTGSKQQLAYFCKTMIKKDYVKLPIGETIWMVVRSHIVDAEGKQFGDDLHDQHIPNDKTRIILDGLVELLNMKKSEAQILKEYVALFSA